MSFLRNAPVRVLAILAALVIVALTIFIQVVLINRLELSEAAAGGVFAVVAFATIVLFLGPRLSTHAGGKRTTLFFALLLLAGAGLFLYVKLVMLPHAIEEAQHRAAQRR